MLRTFEQNGWILEVDRESTAELYQKIPLISECTCGYCLNFVTAYVHFPQAVKDFFEQFGIDPRREGEVYHLGDEKEGTFLYGGFFHFVGRLNGTGQDLEIVPGFEVSFNTKNHLLPKTWEGPAVQMDILFQNVPWMFDLSPNELYKKLHPAKA